MTESAAGATFDTSDGMVVVIGVISGFVVTHSLELLLLEDIDEQSANFNRFVSLKYASSAFFRRTTRSSA